MSNASKGGLDTKNKTKLEELNPDFSFTRSLSFSNLTKSLKI